MASPRKKKRNKRLRRLRHVLEYVLFCGVVAAIRCVPERAVPWIARAAAAAICALPRRWTRADVVDRNLRRALGDEYSPQRAETIRRGMWQHLFELVAEVVRLIPRLDIERTLELVEFRNKAAVLDALLSGRPVILLSGHIGNWELAVAVFGVWGLRMHVIARDLDNPYLDRWFRRYRQWTGHVALAKQGDYDRIIDTLRHNQHLALLADQDAGPTGVFVNFFGEPASTFKSIALLALRYDAIICVGYAHRLPGRSPNGTPRFELGCEDVIDPRTIDDADPIAALTQRYTAALERIIRRAPEQYFWLHRRWKSQPGRRRRKRTALVESTGTQSTATSPAATSPSPSGPAVVLPSESASAAAPESAAVPESPVVAPTSESAARRDVA